MMHAVTDSMAERTGRSVDEWVAAVNASGVDPLDQKAVRRWLKDVHGVPQNSQWAIAFAAAEAAGWERPSTQEYADTLYSGTKASLRPLHDAVVRLALDQGEEAEAQGRGTYIPVVRKSQFAAVAPGPRGTLRVGLRFRGSVPGEPRLEPAKGFAQATHWVHLPGDTEPDDVDWLEPLLAEAYRQNG
jgi:hypothetical protein